VSWPELRSEVAVTVAAKLREVGIYSATPPDQGPSGAISGKDSPGEQQAALGASPDSRTNPARLSRGNS
jgi:hypothetical protein